MSNLVLLKWRPFKYKVKFRKKRKKGLFNLGLKFKYLFFYFSKDCTKKVLKIFKSIVTGNFKPCHYVPKRQPFKVFVKIHESPLLIANIVKGAVSGLRSSWKMMKNVFYFILIALLVLVLQIFYLTFLVMQKKWFN